MVHVGIELKLDSEQEIDSIGGALAAAETDACFKNPVAGSQLS